MVRRVGFGSSGDDGAARAKRLRHDLSRNEDGRPPDPPPPRPRRSDRRRAGLLSTLMLLAVVLVLIAGGLGVAYSGYLEGNLMAMVAGLVFAVASASMGLSTVLRRLLGVGR